MKRIFALVIVILMIPAIAAAEWYPFGLTSADDFAAAREKVKTATGVTYKETLSYITSNPMNYKMDGLAVDTFLVNRPSGTKWRLTILLKAELTEYDKVYDMYETLVQCLGEPIRTDPMITSMNFDGTSTQTSPFADKGDFMMTAINNFPSTSGYIAEFENVIYRIMESWSTGTTVGLYFECPE